MRIRREENEKRLGLATTSMVGSADHVFTQRLESGAGNQPGHDGREAGYAEIASIGWRRIKRAISGAVQDWNIRTIGWAFRGTGLRLPILDWPDWGYRYHEWHGVARRWTAKAFATAIYNLLVILLQRASPVAEAALRALIDPRFLSILMQLQKAGRTKRAEKVDAEPGRTKEFKGEEYATARPSWKLIPEVDAKRTFVTLQYEGYDQGSGLLFIFCQLS